MMITGRSIAHLLLALVLTGLSGCRTTPITGRRQLLLLPEPNEIKMGIDAYQDTLASERPSADSEMSAIVKRVGNRIARVADRPDYNWEFQLIASPQANAFCLPGGKVAVYEGILPICRSEAGLAVVMSHEIAHALARHGGERLSQQSVVAGLGMLVDYATLNQTQLTRDRATKAFGLASRYGFTLPYSRKHELEADHMGMILMAQAGYDPREAPQFWERFGRAQAASGQTIEFLSTHPADSRRAAQLLELIPEAMAEYERAAEKLGSGQELKFQLARQSDADRAG